MKLSEIHINPNNPRIIKDDRFKKLVKSITEFPKMMELRPIVIDSEGMILGGNMRFKALKDLKYKEVPDTWVKRADELTDEEKRRFIIEDNVPFGEWDFNALQDWDKDLLMDWGVEFDFNESENNSEENNNYSRKVEIPTYEPKNEKPEVTELYNIEKYNNLILNIENSLISEGEKRFLKVAASRHIVFNYSNIADYYAHSEKSVQELMEDSALVIIDFNKAIELGFVKLSEQIAEAYNEEYGD